MHYLRHRSSHIAVVAVLLGLIVLPMNRLQNLWLGVGIKTVCLLSYPLVLYVAGLYRPGELQYVRESLGAFLKSRRSR